MGRWEKIVEGKEKAPKPQLTVSSQAIFLAAAPRDSFLPVSMASSPTSHTHTCSHCHSLMALPLLGSGGVGAL